MIKEFKEFISKGSVIDLAVAVIIGSAFGKIIASLVNDVIMPVIGIILGGLNFSELSATVGSAVIKYGAFIQSIIDFLVIALCIFFIIKLINRLKRKKEEVPAEPPKPSNEELLLAEIRDLLKK